MNRNKFANSPEQAPNNSAPLTPTEKIVLRLVSKGCPTHDVADRLMVSVETVRKHMLNSYRKLGVNNRLEAVKKAGFLVER